MIKINLLPTKKAHVSNTEKKVVLCLGLLLGVGFLFLVLILWSGVKIKELERQIEAEQNLRQVLLVQVRRVNELEKKMEQIGSNLEAIRQIRTIQQLPIRYVEALVQVMPEQSLWFESLNLNREGTLEIRGVALDNQTFAGYVDRLRESGYIHAVSTQRTSRRQVMNLDLVEFDFRIKAGQFLESEQTSSH